MNKQWNKVGQNMRTWEVGGHIHRLGCFFGFVRVVKISFLNRIEDRRVSVSHIPLESQCLCCRFALVHTQTTAWIQAHFSKIQRREYFHKKVSFSTNCQELVYA